MVVLSNKKGQEGVTRTYDANYFYTVHIHYYIIYDDIYVNKENDLMEYFDLLILLVEAYEQNLKYQCFPCSMVVWCSMVRFIILHKYATLKLCFKIWNSHW